MLLDIEDAVLDRPAQVRIDDQSGVTALRGGESEVGDGGGFAFARPAAHHRNRVGLRILAIELNVRAQDSIGLGIRRIARLPCAGA